MNSSAEVMSQAQSSRFSGFVVLVLICLLSSVFSPVAVAESRWEEDGWLRTALAQERLANGDEFGCYGMPNLEWAADPEKPPSHGLQIVSNHCTRNICSS